MRNYLIMVEGAHDIAVVERLLYLSGVKQHVRNEDDLPEVWIHTIPSVYPFVDGKLDRITPVPSFLKNEEVSVAIKNANSDTEIMPVLQQIMDTMLVSEKDQLDGIMLICDADQKTALQKRQKMLDSYQEKSDFKIIQEKDSVRLDVGIRVMPLYTFLFPDNNGRGNLENLLLETAEVAYPGLLGLAKDYVAGASEFQQKLRKDSCAKKAVVGCIANAMKPGKANQVSIADDEWISEKTLKTCRMLAALNNELQRMIK